MSGNAHFYNKPKPEDCDGNCSHNITAWKKHIVLYNNGDDSYAESFSTREEAEDFISRFQRMVELAFPKES